MRGRDQTRPGGKETDEERKKRGTHPDEKEVRECRRIRAVGVSKIGKRKYASWVPHSGREDIKRRSEALSDREAREVNMGLDDRLLENMAGLTLNLDFLFSISANLDSSSFLAVSFCRRSDSRSLSIRPRSSFWAERSERASARACWRRERSVSHSAERRSRSLAMSAIGRCKGRSLDQRQWIRDG